MKIHCVECDHGFEVEVHFESGDVEVVGADECPSCGVVFSTADVDRMTEGPLAKLVAYNRELAAGI